MLTFLCFLLPSKYAAEMRIGLKSPLVFAIVLLLVEILMIPRVMLGMIVAQEEVGIERVIESVHVYADGIAEFVPGSEKNSILPRSVMVSFISA